MKILMAATLILFGGFWIFQATAIPMVMRTRALSDAAQMEHNLLLWASEKEISGKLEDGDIRELFPDGRSLRFGGENPRKNFHEMIRDIAVSSAPPVYPGIVAVMIGLGGLGRCFICKSKNKAEDVSPDA